jgi:fructoselysine-6-P-deglycase FrlB-like protein
VTSVDPSRRAPGRPELREGPPWVMEDMIAAQPGLAAPIAEAAGAAGIAHAVTAAAQAARPIVVVGCGTSEHGALAVTALLAEALRATGSHARPECRQSLDAALDPRPGGVCIGISHDGTTRATIHALAAARAAGAATATIGARDDSPLARDADCALITPLRDRSWCHTVAYTGTILAGAAIAAAIDGRDRSGSGATITAALAERARIEQLAARLHGASRILAVGLGADLTTARELALKIEEGARIPATALHLESFLHGHLAACEAGTTALVLLAADARGGARRDARLAGAAAAAAAIGIPTVAIGTAAALDGLPAGVECLVTPTGDGAPPLAALLTGAVSLQLLTLALAHLAGSNPDLIRREQAPYREAAAAAGNRANW